PADSPPCAPAPSGDGQPEPAAPDWGGERPGPAAPAFSVRAAVREGLLLVRRAPVTRGLLAANGVYLLANAALTALLIPFGIATFGGSTEVGYLLSALGLGFLIGAPVSRRLVDRFAPRPVVATAQALVGAAFLLLFNSASLPVALAAAVLLGLPGVTVLVAVQTHVQRATPGAILGRVTAVFLTVEAAASMVGAFAGPALSEASGLPVALNAACAVALLSAPVTLFLTPAGAGRLR
ncbi:MFS transporter, partial [Nonomuraea sp. MG754425]|uniref:MFS transporter n=1 Tax=Nonomuraea sp. MG754425 TaxID=2570319 RepID=UPI001F02F9F3